MEEWKTFTWMTRVWQEGKQQRAIVKLNRKLSHSVTENVTWLDKTVEHMLENTERENKILMQC
jgi:hypothetical protein